MFDHLLESSRWDDSNKWSYIGFGEEIGILEITRIGSQYVTNAPKQMYSSNGIPFQKSDGQTEERMNGWSDFIMPQILFGGIKNMHLIWSPEISNIFGLIKKILTSGQT